MVEEIRVTSAGDTEVHRIAGEHIEVDDTLVIVVRDSAAEHLDPHLDLLGHIREHPLQALGIALGAGLAVGLLTKRGGDDLDDDDADEADEEGLEEDEADDEDSTDSPAHRLRAFVAEHLSGMAADAVRQLMRRVARA